MLSTAKLWDVLQSISELLKIGIDYGEMFGEDVQFALESDGHSTEEIELTFQWLEDASLSCDLSQIFSMFADGTHSTRVENAVEALNVPSSLYKKIETVRKSGVISLGTAERLIEGCSSVDAKDWSEKDQNDFILKALKPSLPSHAPEGIKKLIRGRKDFSFLN